MIIDKELSRILDNLYEGVYITDRARKIHYWNEAAEEITGFKNSEVIGKHCFENILSHVDDSGKNLCTNGCPLSAVMQDGETREMEVFLHHKKGHRIPISVKALPLKDAEDNVVGVIEFFSEISERKSIIEKIKNLEKLAMLDDLTQLPNRRYMENRLKLALESYLLNNGEFGLIFMDIDNFKVFNDNYGHNIGDKVLKSVARTFASNLRKDDIIGRWGGEEFIGVFSNVNQKQLGKVAEKLRSLVEKTNIEFEDKGLGVTISLGASLIRSGESIGDLIKRSDELMYISKKNGKNCVTLG
jgi:diguanylate cyclase (GGDEF)-like protein/PAS domain S-box-containing protein